MKPTARHRRRILTTREVAELFHVSPRTARRWASSGKLHAARTLGGPWWFDRDHAERAQRERFLWPYQGNLMT